MLPTLAVSQSQPSKSQQLNASVATLYQSGKYDEAILVAEEIVALERKERGSKNLVNALENLAQIQTSRFKRTVAELNAGTVDRSAVNEAVARLRRDAEISESILREALQLADDNQSSLREQRIVIRNSLAWLLYNYQAPDPDASVAFDKTSRDKFEMRAKARFLKRVNEADDLYSQALKIALEDPADIAQLLTTFNWGEFALATGDLENALARFEKCILEVERRFGKDSPDLASPLEPYIRALVATHQDDLALEMVAKLARVTGRTSAMPNTPLNLSLRADKAFAPSNSTSVEANARANKEAATLSGRAATVNSSVDAMLSVSTLGRQYYDLSGPIKITKIAVRVVVDEVGKVVEAEALTTDKETKRDAEAAVKEWKIRPFVGGGKPRRIKGYVEAIVLSASSSK